MFCFRCCEREFHLADGRSGVQERGVFALTPTRLQVRVSGSTCLVTNSLKVAIRVSGSGIPHQQSATANLKVAIKVSGAPFRDHTPTDPRSNYARHHQTKTMTKTRKRMSERQGAYEPLGFGLARGDRGEGEDAIAQLALRCGHVLGGSGARVPACQTSTQVLSERACMACLTPSVAAHVHPCQDHARPVRSRVHACTAQTFLSERACTHAYRARVVHTTPIRHKVRKHALSLPHVLSPHMRISSPPPHFACKRPHQRQTSAKPPRTILFASQVHCGLRRASPWPSCSLYESAAQKGSGEEGVGA